MSRTHTLAGTLMLGMLTAHPVSAAGADPATAVARVIGSGPYKAATATIEAEHERWVAETIALTEIPAPPFKEAARGKAIAPMLAAAGLTDITTDAEGNVMGLRRGTGPAGGKVIVIAAHLDTVFPEGTDVTVKRNGTRLSAPGIGDDSAGLATLLALARAANAPGIRTERDILFVANVGEEGPGDLRGARFLFNKGPYAGRIESFLSLDGSGAGRLVNVGVGSRRFRLTFKGPGGHSYGAFGIVNPAAALGDTITRFYQTVVPTTPKVTYSIGVLGGGTSVNTIPDSVWMEVDMRSADPRELAKVEARLMAVANDAVAAENAARSVRQGVISVVPTVIGDRPAGATVPGNALLRAAEAAHRAFGVEVVYSEGSTDSNVPMALGIPAITLPGSAEAGRAHAPDEWLDVSREPNVRLKAMTLALLLAAAGAE